MLYCGFGYCATQTVEIGVDVQAYDADLDDLADGELTGSKVSSASDSAVGVVELATSAETTTGTEASKAVTPDGLAGSNFGKSTVSIKLTEDGGDALTTGDGKFYFLVPAKLNGMNLVGVDAGVSTVSSSGTPEFQIHNLTDTQDMLSTTLTIDASEYHSKDATTAAVINTSYDDVATGDRLRIDCDTAGTDTAGVQLDLIFQLP